MPKKKNNEEYWIKRAILAEKRVKELEEELKTFISMYKKNEVA